MIDTVAERGWLTSTLRITQLFQMIVQARWIDESAIITLPHIRKEDLHLFSSLSLVLPMLCSITNDNYSRLAKILCEEYQENQMHEVIEFINKIFNIHKFMCVLKIIIFKLLNHY